MATQYAFGQTVTNGLVLALDAADLNSFSGSSSTVWNDLTANQNILGLYNGAVYSTSGNGSIAFDGTNDGVSGSDASVYTITSAISLEVWMRLTVSGNTFIIGKGPSNTGVPTNYPGNYELQTIATNGLAFLHQTTTAASNNSYAYYPTTTNVYSNNTWTHVIATCNGSSATIYTNGTTRTTTRTAGSPTDGGIVSTNTQTLKIGRRTDGIVMAGNLAVVKIYNRILSADEALQNYNAQKSRFGL